MLKFKFSIILLGLLLFLGCSTRKTEFTKEKPNVEYRSTLKVLNHQGELIAVILVHDQPAIGDKTELRLDSGQVLVYWESNNTDLASKIYIASKDEYK